MRPWVFAYLLLVIASAADARPARYAYKPTLGTEQITIEAVDLSVARTDHSGKIRLWDGLEVDSVEPFLSGEDDGCTVVPLAVQGWTVDGNALRPRATLNPATINAFGTMASVGEVLPSSPFGEFPDRVIYTADEDGLEVLVYGCGDGGVSGQNGCGDPAPRGGTIGGLFQGTYFVPAINDAGDVLFLADIDDGPSPRGLFLYREATDSIDLVAAAGDLIPETGENIETIGLGSLNNHGEVVFLVETVGFQLSGQHILKWSDGELSVVTSYGSPLPGGRTVLSLFTEWIAFEDEFWIPVGPVPDINDEGDVLFLAYSDRTYFGIFMDTAEGVEPILQIDGHGPGYGPLPFVPSTWAPIMNEAGDIAILGDEFGIPAWYLRDGVTQIWRRVFEPDEIIGGGDLISMAVSRNPMQPLSDDGSLVLTVGVIPEVGPVVERVVLATPDGENLVVIAEGEPCEFGGRYWVHNGWPSINGSNVACVGTRTIDGPESGHVIAFGCGTSSGLGTRERFSNTELCAFPNPSTGTVTLSLEGGAWTEPARLRIFDAHGRLIHSDQKPRTHGAHSWTWGISPEVEGIPAGTYLAVVETDSDRVTRKFQFLR